MMTVGASWDLHGNWAMRALPRDLIKASVKKVFVALHWFAWPLPARIMQQ